MKTEAYLVILFSCIGLNGFSQNRISSWDREKITSIWIETRTADEKNEIILFDAKPDLDTIFSFLKKIDFKEIENPGFDIGKIMDQWLIRMSFRGSHDQISFFKDYATIGKTIFSIDKNVIPDLRAMISECKKRKETR